MFDALRRLLKKPPQKKVRPIQARYETVPLWPIDTAGTWHVELRKNGRAYARVNVGSISSLMKANE